MHQTKINLQPAFTQSEVGKTNPDWIDEHCKQTAIVNAMKLIEQKQNGKIVY